MENRPIRTLIASIMFVGCLCWWLVEAENKIQELEYRLQQVEGRLERRPSHDFRWVSTADFLRRVNAGEQTWGWIWPSKKERAGDIYLEYLTPDLTTVKTTLRRGESR